MGQNDAREDEVSGSIAEDLWRSARAAARRSGRIGSRSLVLVAVSRNLRQSRLVVWCAWCGAFSDGQGNWADIPGFHLKPNENHDANAADCAAVLVALAAVPLASASPRHAARYPSSIAILGTATAAGWQSNPAHPSQQARENAWATGTNPAVDSIYLRLLALNPAITGHNFNLSNGDNALELAGHELDNFAAEVHKVLQLNTKPDLVLVQVIDRALKCDGTTERDFAGYGAKFGSSLNTLAQGLPSSKILVISQWGSFASYVKYLNALPTPDRLKNASKKSPCVLVTSPSGQVVPSRVAYSKSIVAGEEAQLKAACAKVANCRYDGGAASRITVTAADVASFQYTPTIQGQAKIAAAEWKSIATFVK